MISPQKLFKNPRLFFYVLAAICMSAYDAVATVQHIARGVAAEGNPFMEPLIEINAVLFFAVKMLVTVGCLLLCYKFSHLRTARLGIRLAVAAYAIVSVYHAVIVLLVEA